MNIQEAVKMVSDDLQSGRQFDQSVKEAAEEYKLNPVLVARKFQEAFGAPEKFLETVSRAKQLATERDRQLLEDAKTEVKRWSKEFTISWSGALLEGKPFDWKGEPMLFVAYTGSKVWFVRVRDTQQAWLPGRCIRKIMEQVAA